MARVGDGTREMILFSLAGKGGKEARDIIEDLHRQTGLSVGHLYRMTDPVRLNGRAHRRDEGQRRTSISENQLEWIRGVTVLYDMTAKMAIELAEINEVIPARTLAPATYNRWIYERGLSRKRLKLDTSPYEKWEATAPNVIHQFDTTKLEELHYDKEADTLSWDPRANRKNSRGEKPDSIWLYSMLDDFSRCKYARLYRSLNQFNHVDFLILAWSQKDCPAEFPFYGLPGHIYMDRGGGNQGLRFLVALEKLGVHRIPTEPSTAKEHGARKHGKIENVFKSYKEWQKKFKVRPMTWDEAQESLCQFVLDLNNTIHSETHAEPFRRWLQIGTPQHAPSEELSKILQYDHERRKVEGDLAFSLHGYLYRLPQEKHWIDAIGSKIDLYFKPRDYEAVFAVFRSREIEIKRQTAEIVRPAFSYDREQRPETIIEGERRRAAHIDYANIRLHRGDTKRPAYLPRKGEEFDEARIAEKWVGAEGQSEIENPKSKIDRRPSFAPERWLSYVEAALELKATGFFNDGQLSEGDKAWLRAILAGREKISETELVAAVKRAKDDAAKMEAKG